MTTDEALQWADGTPEYRRMDIHQRDPLNEEALDTIAAEVRRLREELGRPTETERQNAILREAITAYLSAYTELSNAETDDQEAHARWRIVQAIRGMRDALQRAGGDSK